MSKVKFVINSFSTNMIMLLDSTTFYEESSTLYIKDARKIQLNNKMLAFVIHAAMNVARIVEKNT